MKLAPKLEEYRLLTGDYGSRPGAPFGVFMMPGLCGEALRAMADDGSSNGWEHVSVSTQRGKARPELAGDVLYQESVLGTRGLRGAVSPTRIPLRQQFLCGAAFMALHPARLSYAA